MDESSLPKGNAVHIHALAGYLKRSFDQFFAGHLQMDVASVLMATQSMHLWVLRNCATRMIEQKDVSNLPEDVREAPEVDAYVRCCLFGTALQTWEASLVASMNSEERAGAMRAYLYAKTTHARLERVLLQADDRVGVRGCLHKLIDETDERITRAQEPRPRDNRAE